MEPQYFQQNLCYNKSINILYEGKNMKKLYIATIVVAGTAIVMMTGCSTKAGTGSLIGAGGGAALGGLVGGSRGAAVGAALGGVSGAAIGANEDKKDRERRYR
jgi:hypothetical protein